MQTLLQLAINGMTAPSNFLEWLMVAAFLAPIAALVYRAYKKDTKLGDLIKPIPVGILALITVGLTWIVATLTVIMFMIPLTYAWLLCLGTMIGAVFLMIGRYIGLDIPG